MGIKRIIDTAFWTDSKVDEFTPEDKYFMLYLLTNPFTTQLGIYEISVKQVAFQLGYSVEAVMSLLDRFDSKYGIIIFSKSTNEIAIKNFLRHSIVKGGKPVEDCLKKELQKIKNKSLISTIFQHISSYDNLNDTVKKIVDEYKIENDNDNDNERIVNESSTNRQTQKKLTKTASRFTPPTLDEVKNYCLERNNNVDAERFIDYYTSNGWKVGKNPMKDWKAAIRTWEKGDKGKQNKGVMNNGNDKRDNETNEFKQFISGGLYL